MDYRIFHALNNLAGRWHVVDTAVRGFAKDGIVLFPLALLLVWILPGLEAHRVRTGAVAGALAALAALGVNQVFNHLVQRPRPYASHVVHLLLPRTGDTSFPSDHTVVALAVAVALLPARRRIGIWLGLAGAVLAATRVIAGAHYPGDVLGGAAVGTACALVLGRVGRRPLGALTSLVERGYEGATRIAVRPAPRA